MAASKEIVPLRTAYRTCAVDKSPADLAEFEQIKLKSWGEEGYFTLWRRYAEDGPVYVAWVYTVIGDPNKGGSKSGELRGPFQSMIPLP